MTAREPRRRVYPMRCTSAYCEHGTCPEDCSGLPALREFETWAERTGARPADSVWSPLVFVVPDPEEVQP